MLKEMELKPGNPQLSHDVIIKPKLKELDITLMEYSRWQAISRIPRHEGYTTNGYMMLPFAPLPAPRMRAILNARPTLDMHLPTSSAHAGYTWETSPKSGLVSYQLRACGLYSKRMLSIKKAGITPPITTGGK